MSKLSIHTLLGSAGLAALLLTSGCQGGGDAGFDRQALSAANETTIDALPLAVHRRAAQLLEDVRGTESAPTWDRADFDRTVRVLHRPDVEGAAYYELQVLVEGQPSGYIILTNPDPSEQGDFPVAHWDFNGSSPTHQLDELARGEEIATYYKLDSLSYVAMGLDGEMVANLGALPPRIIGQDPRWLDDPAPDTTATWVPDQSTGSDDQASRLGGRMSYEGPEGPGPFEIGTWESFGELLAGYRGTYATMIESLRRQAADEWDTDRYADENGEGVIEEVPFDVALLYPDAEISADGEGSRQIELLTRESTPGREVLVITAHDARPGEEIPFSITIAYPNSQKETLRFIILSAKDIGGAAVSQKRDNVAWADLGAQSSWGSWNYFWAGSHDDQRLYDQMSAGSSPNTSGCYSGCGATAWAMLFGWGDFQAGSGNPAWSHRWGLYRQNGGYGSNVVAPKYMDTGVRNMTWELRNRIHTFCAFGSGATAPWDMDDASGYLVNRTGASLTTNYNILGIHTTGLREKARDSIIDRHVPAIIGTGWLTHYPLAYGYRWRSRNVKKCFLFICWDETEYQRQFYVNQGWGGSGNGWVSAGTWFAGRLFAN